jgi:hypothetical protein
MNGWEEYVAKSRRLVQSGTESIIRMYSMFCAPFCPHAYMSKRVTMRAARPRETK